MTEPNPIANDVAPDKLDNNPCDFVAVASAPSAAASPFGLGMNRGETPVSPGLIHNPLNSDKTGDESNV